METFIIREMQTSNDTRKGEEITCADLSEAKRRASKMQLFQGTVLTIESPNGAVLAIKRNGRWRWPAEDTEESGEESGEESV